MRTTLSSVIQRHTKLQKAGREWKACCPFHKEKTPSFTVNDEKGFYHCLAAETGVMTARGVAPIADLAGKEVKVLAPGGEWIPSPFKAFGRQKLWRIELGRNGVRKSVFATSHHRWFIRGRNSEILTGDLRVGQRLKAVLPAQKPQWDLDPAGVRHGVVFGDGTMYRGGYGTINLHGDKDAKLAFWFPDQKHGKRLRSNGASYLRIYGGRDFAHMKTLPSLDSGDEYLLGFLAGYIAADGHVAKDGTVMLNSARREHLEKIRDIATALGIGTYGITRQRRIGFGRRETDLFRIHFVPSTLEPEFFILETARARFEANDKKFDRLRWSVRSVEPTDRIEEVYCAQVPQKHAFALEDNILTGNCFGCGAHGDAISFVTETRGLSFIDAVKELADQAGMQMPAPDPQARERQERTASLRDVLEAAAGWYAEQLAGPAGAEARVYLEQRGISAETQRRFGLGFAPDDRGRLEAALKQFDRKLLLDSGLLAQPDDDRAPYDRFRNRLMFPIRDRRGRVIAFSGRIIGDGKPKYLNSPDTPVFDKGRELYNLDRAGPASRDAGRIVVVEGQMDVVALDQAGIAETVAPLGTALTENQIPMLWRLADEPVICFDGDAAGQRAALRAAERALSVTQPGKSLRFAMLPSGEDPDDLVRRAGAKAFEEVIARAAPMVDMLYVRQRDAARTKTPEGRAGLKSELDALAAKAAHPDIAREYKRSFAAFFYDEFGWRKSERDEIRRAILKTGPRGDRHLTPLFVRSMLYGLSRFPAVIRATSEQVAGIDMDAAQFARWREVLLNAAFARPNLDSDAVRAILESADLSAAMRRDLRYDLRFPWDVDSRFAGKRLEGVIRLLGEEDALAREMARLNRAASADTALENYEEIEAARRQLRDRKQALYETSISALLDEDEEQLDETTHG